MFLRSWTLAATLGALLVACSADTPEQLIASAKGYLAKGDTRAAVIQLKTALQKDATSAESRFLLGSTLLLNGDVVAAEVELRKARELKFSDDQVLPLLARAMVQQGKGKAVASEFGATVLPNPQAQAALKTALVMAYGTSGDEASAQAALRSALQADADHAPALLVQAKVTAGAGNVDGGMQIVEKVISRAPRDVDAWLLKGDLLARVKRDTAGGLQAYRKALELQPNSAAAHANIVELQLAVGDVKAAAQQVAELKKARPNDPATKYFEARTAFASGDLKLAKDLTQQLLKLAPGNPNVLQIAGAVELRTASYLQAETLLQKALQAAPERPALRALLGQTYVSWGQPAKALTMLAPLLEQNPPDPAVLALAGEAHMRLGEIDKAQVLFAEASTLNPADHRSKTALALTQLSKGNAEAAYADLHDIALVDKGTTADLALISALLGRKEFDKAFKALDDLERKTPAEALPFHLRGTAQLASAQPDAARASFEKALTKDATYFPSAARLAALDLQAKQPDRARQRFEAMLRAKPGHLQAQLALAELQMRAGAKPEQIDALLAEAMKLHPDEAAPRVLLVTHQLAQKQTAQALATAQTASTALPDNPMVLEALGKAQIATGDSLQAVNTFGKIAALQPASPGPHMQLAALHVAAKNASAAEQSLKRALAIAPTLLPAQELLIKLHLDAGRPAEALAVARSVQKQRPEASPGYVYEGEIEARSKKWDAAALAFKKGTDKAAPTPAAIGLHRVLVASGKATDSGRMAEDWLKQHPSDAPFLEYLGAVDLANKNLASAEARFRKVIELQPNNAAALNNVSWVMTKAGKPGALPFAEKADALAPNRPAIMETLALALAGEKQLDKALELQLKAVALAPKSDALRLTLARLYLQSGQKALAKNELEQVAKAGETFPEQAEVKALLSGL